MGHFQIPYHKTPVSVSIPDENVQYYIDLKLTVSGKSNALLLEEAISRSDAGLLGEFVEGKSVGLIVEDSTRDVPLEDLLETSGPGLSKARHIVVFIATGTHDGENEGNRKITEQVLTCQKKYNLAIEKIVLNDCHADTFYLAGTTTGINNQIYVHRDSKDVDVFVVFSDMKNHYFAGYSNAIKNFMPGICNYESTEKNHSLALDDHSTFGYHPLHPDPDRRYNPLAIDMWEAYQLITAGRPTYVVATISKKETVLWCGAGLLEEIVVKGIEEVDRMMSMKVNRVDKLIVSCGGYPNDESLYTAQRALELSKNGVKDKGEILFFAGCADGLGPEKSINNFFEPLQDEIATILSRLNDKYIMYAHKTYKFAQLIDRMKRISLVSELQPDIVKKIHLSPENQPQSLIDTWLREDPDSSIGIITDGNKLALHRKT